MSWIEVELDTSQKIALRVWRCYGCKAFAVTRADSMYTPTECAICKNGGRRRR